MKVNLRDLCEEDDFDEEDDNQEDIKESRTSRKKEENLRTFERLKKNEHKDY